VIAKAVTSSKQYRTVGVKPVIVRGSILFADIARSTKLITSCDAEYAARVLQTFLKIAAWAIRYHQGEIRSFDGDRVMAVFVDRDGTNHVEDALKAALCINTFVRQVGVPRLDAMARLRPRTRAYTLGHAIGIASGMFHVFTAGTTENNDLIFMGPATNLAARLSDWRDADFSIFLSGDAHQLIESGSLKDSGLWVALPDTVLGAKVWATNAVLQQVRGFTAEDEFFNTDDFASIGDDVESYDFLEDIEDNYEEPEQDRSLTWYQDGVSLEDMREEYEDAWQPRAYDDYPSMS
jgi:class 3 adenylate cyclase